MTIKKNSNGTKNKVEPAPASAGAGSPVAANPAAIPSGSDSMVDNPVNATTTENNFAIVGIGASAGGLKAFEAFFSGIPADLALNMAFVLVQHLAPDHESLLTELIRRITRLQVFEVEDGVVVQPSCIYIIPPDRDMAFLNGTLHLLEPVAPRGHRFPIDFLFKSLAQDQHDRAIGIVLSGTGSDGTEGIRAIKSEGGMVMAQKAATAEFCGMPRSALATGLVDYEIEPNEMPAQLIAYISHAFGKVFRAVPSSLPQDENALRKLFILLRAQTGHDFSQYKSNTICRRIDRRMAVHQLSSVESYVKYLQQTPAEIDALFHDLLIGVTSFFRDPSAFIECETQIIPKLFNNKSAGDTIRVWSTGCSTGEEAYSLAILLQEHMEKLKQSYKLQVFATDIDSYAIATARAGVYPASIANDMPPERLNRFFTLDADGNTYRVHKIIRDMMIFSEQNVIKDPPFSKLDLISCRNLLIYLGADLQKKIIALFHYALNPDGLLFLGTSETVGEFGDLFAVLDRKCKLYQRKEDFQGAQRAALGRFLPHMPLMATQDAALTLAKKAPAAAKISMRELTEQALLQHCATVGLLVNSQGDILYLHGRSGLFLEPAPGEAGINNVLKMARHGLRSELTTSLYTAVKSKTYTRARQVWVKTNGHYTHGNLSIYPVTTPTAKPVSGRAAALESALYLVTLDEVPAGDVANDTSNPAALTATVESVPRAGAPRLSANAEARKQHSHHKDAAAHIAELNDELQAKEEYLRSTNEELETSNEELKSSNEEMQSVNEELQSSNEELETSKEEMQSINEELSTVNSELQTKVNDLSRANNDMNNLLAGTGIGTIFVDHYLRILRFTPAATLIINLITSDVGRPVAHIVSNLLKYDSLAADVQTVLKTLMPKEVTVQTVEEKFYTMRILPYRTLENVIEGAVLTFVEITEMVRAREALHEANALLRLAVVVRDAFDAITVQDLTGRITAWNPGATRMYGWTEDEALRMNARDRIPPELREQALARIHQLSQSEILEPYLTERLAKNGKTLNVSLTSTALLNEAGEMYAIATTERSKESKLAKK